MAEEEDDKPAEKPANKPASQEGQGKKGESKGSSNPLKELAGASGLGGIFGNAHHGLGLFPVS